MFLFKTKNTLINVSILNMNFKKLTKLNELHKIDSNHAAMK